MSAKCTLYKAWNQLWENRDAMGLNSHFTCPYYTILFIEILVSSDVKVWHGVHFIQCGTDCGKVQSRGVKTVLSHNTAVVWY